MRNPTKKKLTLQDYHISPNIKSVIKFTNYDWDIILKDKVYVLL